MANMKHFTAVAAILIGSIAFGQLPAVKPKGFDRIVWGDQGERYFFPFDPGLPAFVDRLGARVRSKLAQPGTPGNGWSVSGGNVYFLRASNSGTSETIELFQTDCNQPKLVWESIGCINASRGIPLFIVPLAKKDQFLTFNWIEGFVDKEKASFAAIFKKTSKNAIEFDTLIDMPFNDHKTICRFIPGVENQDANCSPLLDSLHPTLWSPVITQDYVYLAATQSGVVWAFSLKNGECAKTINLGGLNLKDLAKLKFIDHFLLGIQPTKDGEIVIATRHPDILKTALSLNPDKDESKEAFTLAKSDFTQFSKEDGRIVWWELRPDESKARINNNAIFKATDGLSFAQIGALKFLVDEAGIIVTNYSKDWGKLVNQLQTERVNKPKNNILGSPTEKP